MTLAYAFMLWSLEPAFRAWCERLADDCNAILFLTRLGYGRLQPGLLPWAAVRA